MEGFVTTFGIVSGLNTSSFSEGDSLWLSASAGKFTNVIPTQPNHGVFIGYCLKSHHSAGQIFVKIQNGYELEELHNVLIQTASNNHILSYNSASSLWMNKGLQSAIKEVDGSGSGVDADLLDGQHGSHYLDWTNTTNKPGPIVAVNLTGNTTGAASATLTDLTNGQISIDTKTSHATSASSIAGSLVEGVVASANFTVNSNQLGGYNESYFLNTSSAVQTKHGNLNIGGTLTTHNLYVSGSTTSINTSSLEVNDPVIYIGLSQYSSDVLDLGFIAPYGDIGSSSVAGNHNHTGLIRDHSDKKWKLLANANHPINNLFDFNSPSVTYATLIVGSIEVSSSATVNNFSADMLDGYHQGHFLPAGTASATYLSQANASATYVIQQDFDNIVVLQWMGIG